MAEIKTKLTKESAKKFVESVSDEARRKDGLVLLKLFTKITGETPRMWGTSIVGFGKYHYKSEHSAQEGDWMLTGFSPRKQNLTLYIVPYKTTIPGFNDLLKKLGKHKMGGGCLYINKLTDVDLKVLEQLIKKSYTHRKKKV